MESSHFERTQARGPEAGRKRSLAGSRAPDVTISPLEAFSKRTKTTHEFAEVTKRALLTGDDFPPMHTVESVLARPLIKMEQESPALAGISWNQGVQHSLRTSFTKRSSPRSRTPCVSKTANTAHDAPTAEPLELRLGNQSGNPHIIQVTSEASDASEKVPDTSAMLQRDARPQTKKRPSSPNSTNIQHEGPSIFSRNPVTTHFEQVDEAKVAERDAEMANSTRTRNSVHYEIPTSSASTPSIYPNRVATHISRDFKDGTRTLPQPSDLVKDGNLISLQDLSLAHFVPSYMDLNLGMKKATTRKNTKLAFRQYMSSYYPDSEESKSLIDQTMLQTRSSSAATIIDQARNDSALRHNKSLSATSGKSMADEKQNGTKVLRKASSAGPPPQAHIPTVGQVSDALDATRSKQHFGPLAPSAMASQFVQSARLTSSPKSYKASHDKTRPHTSEAFSTKTSIPSVSAPTSLVDPQEEQGSDLRSTEQSRFIDDVTTVHAQALSVAASNEETQLSREYFLSMRIDTSTLLCLTCANFGHKSTTCPHRTCSTCGVEGAHATSACPKTQRCGKCVMLGHHMKYCKEKLLPSKLERPGCKFCHSQDHLEMTCHQLWRSFEPHLENIQKVQNIPVHCYTCGNPDHYGPECGLYTRKLVSAGVTWSRPNLDLYVDPLSQNQALSINTNYSVKMFNQVLNIKGKAAHYVADESDDDVQFFGARVAARPIKKAVSISQVQQKPHVHGGNRTKNSHLNSKHNFEQRGLLRAPASKGLPEKGEGRAVAGADSRIEVSLAKRDHGVSGTRPPSRFRSALSPQATKGRSKTGQGSWKARRSRKN